MKPSLNNASPCSLLPCLLVTFMAWSSVRGADTAWSMKKLPDTGQTIKYSSTFGEDADYTINPPSFTDNGNNSITDNVTGLIWQKADGGEMTWENALAYANNLNLGGKSDWRLPTPHELISILNHGRNPALDSSFFTLSSAEYWWSSDVMAGDSSRIWVSNSGGGIGPHPKSETLSAGGSKRFHVRCVRGAAPPSGHPIHSLKDNQDGTISDLDTGLVWQKAEVSPAMTWEEALKYAENLVLAGCSDWRLPNIKELQSLNDETFINPSLDRSYFPGATSSRYWSSTTLLSNQPTRAWFLDFQSGIASYDEKTLARQVRCVRGGMSDSTRLSLALAPGGAVTASTERLPDAALVVGYATATISTGTVPYGTAVFRLVQDGVVVSECGVPSSPPTKAGRIFIDYGMGVPASPVQLGAAPIDVSTGIAIANPNNTPSDLTFILRNTQGQTLATGHATLAAGSHRARFLNQLQEWAPDFILPSDFASKIRYGTLEIASSQAISLLALRMTTNQRRNTLFTSVPAADLTRNVTSSALFFPQLADGDGYSTSLILLNSTGIPQSGWVRFYGDDGWPLITGRIGGSTNTAFHYEIAAHGTFLLQTDGTPTQVHVGSAQLIPDPGSTTPTGAGLYSRIQGGILVTESGIPTSSSSSHARLYVDLAGGHNSGLALAAISSDSCRVTLRAYQLDGITSAGGSPVTLDLRGNGHRAAFIGQWISGLPVNFRGVLDVAGSTPFAALTLRSLINGHNDFLLTTFPLADLMQPAPWPLIFPHIADGGGYQSEFILLSTGDAAGLVLSFFGDNGTPLSIGP